VALAVGAFLLLARLRAAGVVALTLGLAVSAVPILLPREALGHSAGSALPRLGQVDGPVKHFELTAAKQADGSWAFNHLVPGPPLRVAKGDVVEVVLRNTDISDGVTLHWHGYAVPNGDDGVAGLTQDAVLPGGQFVYRFVADRAGSYWYHTHQLSSVGVRNGLFGSFIVDDPDETRADVDLVVAAHRLLAEATTRDVPRGARVRLRLVNADEVAHGFVLSGTPWKLLAIDGMPVSDPAEVADRTLRLAAGGRYDVVFEMPAGPVRLGLDGSIRLALNGPGGGTVPAMPELDPLGYGASGELPRRFDRRYTVVLDRQVRLIGLLPQYAYTINGGAWPDVPPLTVRRGEVVKLTVVNRDKESHPMHPHGHHVLVLSRNGIAASGSPLWMDSFDVLPGETWEVALRADNPGVWAAHCHNLPHATKGMMLHLVYEGVSSPYHLGEHNHPE
jgi:FtsP/CotA-like multicopper oxidase with cupredoxin domain